jgi:hypothetical protein
MAVTDAMKLLNCTGYNISLQGNFLEHMFPKGDYYDDEKKTPTRIALNRWNSGARLHWLMSGYVTRADPDLDRLMMETLKKALDDIEGDIWKSGVLGHFPYYKTLQHKPGLLLQSLKPLVEDMSVAVAPLKELVNFQRLDGLFPLCAVSQMRCVMDDDGSDMHVRQRWVGKLSSQPYTNESMCLRQEELDVDVVYIVR